MTMKPWAHRSNRQVEDGVETDPGSAELHLRDAAPTITTMQADCCVAAAAYRVVLPATAHRPEPAELLFCGHHFRASQAGLRQANASAFDEHNLACLVTN